MSSTPNTGINEALARELAGNLENINKGVSAIRDEVTRNAAALAEVSGSTKQLRIDVDSTVKKYDEIKATMDSVTRQIRKSSAQAMGIPGAEDDIEGFSMLRVSTAVATRDWANAKVEKAKLDEWVTRNTHVADINSRGGTFIPDFVIADVIGAVYAKSAFINLDGAGDGETLISVINGVPGLNGTIPKVNGGIISYWVGEEDDLVASQMTAGDLTYALKSLGNMAKITQRMREYATPGFEAFYRNDMVRSLVAKLDNTIPYGSGTAHTPTGIVRRAGYLDGPQVFSAKTGAICAPTAAGATVPGSNTGAELTFDHLDEMMGAVEDADLGTGEDSSASFVFATRTKRRVKQLKVSNFSGQTDGQPYLLGLPRLPDSRLAEVIGRFVTSTQIPTKQTAGQSVGWTPADANVKRCADVFYSSAWAETVLIRGMGLRIEDDGGKGVGFARGTLFVKILGDFDVVQRRPGNIVVCPDAYCRN